MHVYIQTKEDKAIRFEVLSYDKETGIGRLRSALGTDFNRDISRASLEKYGFELMSSEEVLPLIGSTPKPADEPVRKRKRVAEEQEDDDD